MERIPRTSDLSLLNYMLGYLPTQVRRLITCDFFVATDPIWAGLHAVDVTDDGRSYRDISHMCYEHHTADKRCTLVISSRHLSDWLILLHEFGHAVHWSFGLEPLIAPLDSYAATNEREAFATGFQSWYSLGVNEKHYHSREDVQRYDPKGAVFLAGLEGRCHLLPWK